VSDKRDAYFALNEKLMRARYAELKASRLADLAVNHAHSAEKIYAACAWQVRELEKEMEQMRRNHGRSGIASR
jgi:hypothetical protein